MPAPGPEALAFLPRFPDAYVEKEKRLQGGSFYSDFSVAYEKPVWLPKAPDSYVEKEKRLQGGSFYSDFSVAYEKPVWLPKAPDSYVEKEKRLEGGPAAFGIPPIATSPTIAQAAYRPTFPSNYVEKEKRLEGGLFYVRLTADHPVPSEQAYRPAYPDYYVEKEKRLEGGLSLVIGFAFDYKASLAESVSWAEQLQAVRSSPGMLAETVSLVEAVRAIYNARAGLGETPSWAESVHALMLQRDPGGHAVALPGLRRVNAVVGGAVRARIRPVQGVQVSLRPVFPAKAVLTEPRLIRADLHPEGAA